MLNKLNTLREEREDGFTLIELLVVILIIGILAAIAIPVFLNQRKTANDGAVESDVKNAATQVESWVVGQKGKATPIDVAAIKTEVKSSAGVKLAVVGNANSYCIIGAHENGKKYVFGTATPTDVPRVQASGDNTNLNYNNETGGLGKACTQTPLPTTWNLTD